MSRKEIKDIQNEYGWFCARELVGADGHTTDDILVIVHETIGDKPSLEILAYWYGISLMSDEEIKDALTQTMNNYIEQNHLDQSNI